MAKYRHKETGMIVNAERYAPGLEDGFADPIKKILFKKKKHSNLIPYVKGIDLGYEKPIMISEKNFIVYHKGYKIVFEDNFFLNLYEAI